MLILKFFCDLPSFMLSSALHIIYMNIIAFCILSGKKIKLAKFFFPRPAMNHSIVSIPFKWCLQKISFSAYSPISSALRQGDRNNILH